MLALCPVRAQELDARMWVTDGTVYTIARSGNAVYVGGAFNYVGPNTGSGALLDATEGKLSPKPLLQVEGVVRTSVSDGEGGWFIGGKFTHVQGVPCLSLAHILPNGRVDPAWNLNPQYNDGFYWHDSKDGEIHALALHKGTLYVGGYFTLIGGLGRKRLAAVDVATRKVTPWKADVGIGVVEALAIANDTLYLGGDFYSVNDEGRRDLASIDLSTGRLTDWNPYYLGTRMFQTRVRIGGLQVVGNTVFVGGDFVYNVGTASREYLAAIDAVTGQFRDWDLGTTGRVFALGVIGNTLYAAGVFTRVGNQSRAGLAAIDGLTGAVTAWNPTGPDDWKGRQWAYALAAADNTVYVGGHFTTLGGVPRDRLAAVDATTGQVSAWSAGMANQPSTGMWKNPHTIHHLNVQHGEVFMGGDFASTGGQRRQNLAAFDASTGQGLPWDPRANDTVRILQVAGSTVYAGGRFTAVGGQNRNRLAAIDAATGQPAAWNPALDGSGVHALAVHNNTVFVGSDFYLRGVDAITGIIKPWNGKTDAKINALLVAGNTLYAGGAFTSVNGQGRQRLAAFEAATGQLKQWSPAADGEVTALAAGNDRLYVGGRFSAVGGQGRNRLAAVDASTGAVTTWRPPFAKTVTSMALVSNTLYVGTEYEFTPSAGRNLADLCTVHATTGEVSLWESFLPFGRPLAIAAYPGIVYVGGDIEAYRTRAAGGFAALGKYISPPNLVKGNVYEDNNGNCTRNEGEKGMVNRMVVAQPGNYFASTDSLGDYTLAVDSGSYTIQQVIPTGQVGWITQLCPSAPAAHPVRFSDAGTGTVTGKNFANRVVAAPLLGIEVATDRRRRCFPGQTVVAYHNSGNREATDVKIYVKLPEHVRLIGADAVYQRVEDNTYLFPVGTLLAGASGRILIKDSVVCNNPTIRGLTQCTKAWITPANPRTPAAQWDRSDVQVQGVCTSPANVRLGLYNRGTGSMADSSSFRVYLDAQMAFHKTYKLSQGDSLILLVPASGRTVRLEADQRPGHPTKTSTNLTLEACGTRADGTVSKGFVTQFPQDDPEPEVAIECLPITDSYDPNDKLVVPAGVTDRKFTPTRATLHYTIRFQNTGTDVAYRVVVVDTLSEHLDPGTLQLGAASHPYALRVSGQGRPVLTFTFDPIHLPDSTRDRAGSNGFVQFSVQPLANRPFQTRIENHADIFFDYNEPIRTNTTLNTLYDVPSVPVASVRLGEGIIQHGTPTATGDPVLAAVRIYPNPASALITVQLTPGMGREVQLSVWDATGRNLCQRSILNTRAGHKEVIDLSGYGKGLYLVRLNTAHGSVVRKVLKN